MVIVIDSELLYGAVKIIRMNPGGVRWVCLTSILMPDNVAITWINLTGIKASIDKGDVPLILGP